MAKNKLQKFEDMKHIPFVLQYPFGVLESEGFPLRGAWHEKMFANDNPIVVELGCGKGEYTVGLARRTPGKNYIGIDIKGARMWSGATTAVEEHLGNVAFLRTHIELLERFFAPGEISEIWITFPDPQMKKYRKRLTSSRFLEMYRRVLAPGGIIHLKTDSPFLYGYTRMLLDANGILPLADTDDLYGNPGSLDNATARPLMDIRTFYEQQWLSRGLSIKYLAFSLPKNVELKEPESEPEPDDYRSFGRNRI